MTDPSEMQHLNWYKWYYKWMEILVHVDSKPQFNNLKDLLASGRIMSLTNRFYTMMAWI